tara:strand:- start:641 stop:964 length:324 start_codon:yes stop_codon:yes gene_type:complete
MISKKLIFCHKFIKEIVRDDGHDLSARQMAIFFSIYMDSKIHTVRSLAAELNIPKSAVNRAINYLSALHFVRRMPDSTDRRSVIIQKTVKGSIYLDKLASRLNEPNK